MNKWISIKEKLPKEGTFVMVVHSKKHPNHPIFACFYEGCFNFGTHNYLLPSTICLDVTHWIPLPPAPKQEE